ncbi:GTPase IMAP family member 4-like [Salminus brasiliensis]|uniref:GTPase IMAP family member 4-like n=1 Tax=Salminus brasiliensis TaxID=930266 RepID=UPI003B832DA8
MEDHAQGSSAGSTEVLQLVLVGPNGSGKSSAGNRILDKEAFRTGTRTRICQIETCKIQDHAVIVVDTPGLTEEESSNQKVIEVITKACQDLLELPIVFLLVVPSGWNVKKTQDWQQVLRRALGNMSPDHVMVLLTHADHTQQEGTKEESILRKTGLLQLTTGRGGGWFHQLNVAESDRGQISELLEKVERMMLDGSPRGRLETTEESLEDGADCRAAISHQKRRVQKRIEVIKSSERIIAENKDLLRKLREEVDAMEEELKAAVAEDRRKALVEKIRVKAADIQAKEEKIQLHIGVLQTLQQQVEEKRKLISRMEKEVSEKEKEHAKTTSHHPGSQKGDPEGAEGAGDMHSFRKNLQKLEDQMRSRRLEEEELARARNVEYRAQLLKIKEKMAK